MIGIYFSGTGNSKYCVEKFLEEYDPKVEAVSIESSDVISKIQQHKEIVIGYLVQYSDLPKKLKGFIVDNNTIWRDKKIFSKQF